jgi:hypothetical protein
MAASGINMLDAAANAYRSPIANIGQRSSSVMFNATSPTDVLYVGAGGGSSRFGNAKLTHAT